jgi:endonuclease/exonuclease/phosphatase family metal-dependent hydrolase
VRNSALLLAFGALACARSRSASISADPSPPSVVIDGVFDDWRDAPLVASTNDSRATITAVRARQDANAIYLQLTLGHAANLIGLDSTIALSFDADGVESTGDTMAGLAGAEFEIDLSPSNAAGRVAEGVVVRTPGARDSARLPDAYTIGLVTQPTTRSRVFELRLSRGRRLDSTKTATVFTSDSYRARISIRSGGVEIEALPVFTAPLPAFVMPQAPDRATDPLARASGSDLRVLQWNVANEGIGARPDRFRRILAAIDPDILLLDEVGGSIGAEGVAKFLASIDSGAHRRPWQFTYGGGGGYQRTVVASRNDVVELPSFRRIAFPDSIANAIFARVPEAGRARVRSSLDDGVATGSAVVSIGGRRVMLVGVDLQSAGNHPNSWQEARRVAEVHIIRGLAEQALRTSVKVDGVIAGGDFNLVSTRDPLDSLAALGRAFDGRPLTIANEVRQLDGSSTVTWDAGSGPFPPGRLDWLTYSGRTLELRGGFVFDARDLSERWRAAHGLEPDDSPRSSDHLPVVLDLQWRR